MWNPTEQYFMRKVEYHQICKAKAGTRKKKDRHQKRLKYFQSKLKEHRAAMLIMGNDYEPDK